MLGSGIKTRSNGIFSLFHPVGHEGVSALRNRIRLLEGLAAREADELGGVLAKGSLMLGSRLWVEEPAALGGVGLVYVGARVEKRRHRVVGVLLHAFHVLGVGDELKERVADKHCGHD